jgi:hypothetical protein
MLRKTLVVVAGTLFLAGTISCGTLMYPERRGQHGGRIDPAVAMLDGVGLLVFIFPGLIAYAIDFSTGAIYLPGTRESGSDAGIRKVQAESRDGATMAAVIERHTGRRPSLAEPGLRIYLPDRQGQDFGRELAALAAGQPVAAAWTACSISPAGTVTTADGRQVTPFPQE